MKKQSFLALVFTAALIANSTPANSSLYFGADAQANTYSGLLTQGSFGAFAGLRLFEFFGAELGYSYHPHLRFNIFGERLTVTSHNVYTDLMGYMPIGDCFDLVGSAGVGLFTTTATLRNHGYAATSSLGFRAGAGVQYNFTSNFGARAMLGYQNVHYGISMVSAKAGVFFQF